MSLNFSFSTYDLLRDHCLMLKVSNFISTGTSAMRIILLLPLCTFILYLGHQQWRQQLKTASHSDLFTYHLAAMELIWIFGFLLTFVGSYAHDTVIMIVGTFSCCMTLFGEIFFHILTCGERYLAVVHPITYRGLRNTRGIRIRNISIGCVWLLCFTQTCFLFSFTTVNYATIALICILILAIIFLSFCSISLLCVLIGPGPGEGGGEKKRVAKSKRRAFQSITAISCVMWLWFVVQIVAFVDQLALDSEGECVIAMCLAVFTLPSCLVQPLLHLQKARKLPCSRGK